MNALLIYPAYPDTFMGHKHALRFVRKKAALPPLGLLTVAAMLPADWPKKVVDLNVQPLTSADLKWADIAFISAMIIQKESTCEIIPRCQAENITIVAGGPLFAHFHQEVEGIDHFIIGEAEDVLPVFLDDLREGRAKPVYRAEEFPGLAETPIPSWDLVDFRYYHLLSVQFSRGCPFDCDFCDVVQLFGRRPRFKTPEQVLDELDILYQLGWRDGVFIADDNFICNKKRATELLHEMVAWQHDHEYPFTFNIQASVDLADDLDILSLMAEANFDSAFLGIESTALDSLKECHKHQNLNRDLVAAVKTIQKYGIAVSGGFIIGFDSDPDSIFDDQVQFIQEAGIPLAMVGLLSAGPGTRLFKRLQDEGRLLGRPSGDNTTDIGALNFVPKMNREKLIAGYKSVLVRLYEPEAYYSRVETFLDQCKEVRLQKHRTHSSIFSRDMASAFRVLWGLGVRSPGRRAFWNFMFRVGFDQPARIPLAMSFAATGYHFRVITDRFIQGQEQALPM